MPLRDENILFPGPDFRIDLPRIDACHPVYYARRLLIFRCASDQQRERQLSAIKRGLRAMVQRCPLLAGKLSRLPPDEASKQVDEWRTIVPSEGLEFVVKDLRKKLPSFAVLERKRFPPTDLKYDLLVPIAKDVDSEGPACRVQYSAIEGGTILCWAMSHSVGDGGTNNELIRVLAEEVMIASKGGDEQGGGREMMDLDRNAVIDIDSGISFRVKDHPGYRAQPLPPTPKETLERASHPFRAVKPEVPLIFTLSPASLAKLKEDARPPAPAWISTHDALVALIWRSQIQLHRQRSPEAQALPESIPTTLFMPSDARGILGLPSSYIGNAVYQLSATLPLSTLLCDNGLRNAALAIRQAILSVTPEKVKSYYAKMREEWVEWAFLESYDTTGVAMGTAWTSGALYEFDWGDDFGNMISYRMPDEAFNAVLPRLMDGGAEIVVSVMPDEVDKLKSIESFMKYVV
ncbi:hypothetical protein FKW77_008340 [Venturia effusa]|uniref:Trichothecene 3-O-acetyltransferase n=1 Tax=Venturia effusa TaxID=50376 RepID=A0A517LKW5_9PEZI|nr:hypothetical protein FKW77_008340 [Venturia effusa]